jgi:polysaccharide biosynthesis transport protein
MSIIQFFRIFWGRRILILSAAISCVVGGFVVTRVLPPRWPASSRVMLNTVKPDPVTGLVIGQGAHAYAATQIELIKDYSVAGQVADELGWMSDPGWIAAYRARSKADKRDFRHWIAQQVTDRSKAELLEGSNILEITYQGMTPDQARAGADALRTAYMDRSLEFRRDEASRNAEWYDGQVAKIQTQVFEADNRKAAFERQNGVVLDDREIDLDTQRLEVLAQQGAGLQAAGVAQLTAPSGYAAQLAEVDAQLAQDTKTLGPNHPELQALRARRAALAALVDREQNAVQKAQEGAATSAARAGANAVDRAIDAQKVRVLAQHDKIAQLHQLQAEVDRLRDLYKATAQKAAEFRQEAATSIDGITPLGAAVTPKAPSFPNKPLILGGSLALGLGVGVLVALLCELFARRVRGAEDLESTTALPVLAVIAAPSKHGTQGISWLRIPPIRPLTVGR